MSASRGKQVVVIGRRGVADALTMAECIGAMERLHREGVAEALAQPSRTITEVDEDSHIITMPAYSGILKRFSVKVVTEFKRNPQESGTPAQGGQLLLIDGSDSRVLAMVDSPELTAVRTGAVSGLAARILSRKESRLLGIIGSGHQARAQLEAMCAVREISEARVYSRDPAHAKDFAKEMAGKVAIKVKPCNEKREAVGRADIIVAATSSVYPVLDWDEVPEGCHVSSIGALAIRRELGLELICRSSLFVDTREGVLREAGDVVHAVSQGRITPASIRADLWELVSQSDSGRRSESEVTLFKSVGLSLQDLYACSYLYDKAARMIHEFAGRGVEEIKLP